MNDDDDGFTKNVPAAKRRKLLKAVQWVVVLGLLGLGSRAIYNVAVAELSSTKPQSTPSSPQGRIISEAEWAKLNEQLEYALAHIASLEEALANLQKNHAAKPETNAVKPSENLLLEAKIEELQNRIENIQKGPSSAQALEHVSLLSAFGQLQKAVKQGKKFNEELALLTQLASRRPTLQELLPPLQLFSTQSPQTLEILKIQFQKSIATRQESADDATSLLGNLRSLVRIRKEGEPQGEDDDAIIARAESKLKEGEVEQAIQELGQLSASAASFFGSWLNAARNYVKLHAALDAIELNLLQPDNVPIQTTQP